MQCAACGDNISDGVQCGSCLNHLDYGCAQIAEKTWRKLGNEKRSVWRCPSCRSKATSPLPSPMSDLTTMDIILKEIREMKSQLSGLPSLINDVKVIKGELSELKQSSDYLSGKIDDFASQMAKIQDRVAKVEDMKKTVYSLESEIHSLQLQLSVMDQRSRLNNVEIKGVPQKKDENLFSVVEALYGKTNLSYSKAQINFLHRTPLHGTKEKSIIVSFLNRYAKEEFVAATRACKTLSASDLGYSNSNQRVFVNDHLNASSKILLNRTKSRAKDMKFDYVWVKHGKIHVRKNDTSPVFVISKEDDLNKIA